MLRFLSFSLKAVVARVSRSRQPLVALFLLTVASGAGAQRSAVVHTAQGSTGHGQSQVEVDYGAAPSSTPMSVVVMLKRSVAQQGELNDFLQKVSTAGAAEFHHWLTSAQFASRFQPSQSAVDSLSAYFTSQGLVVESISAGRSAIRLQGSVAAMNSVFAADLHRVGSAASEAIGATRVPTLPEAQADWVGSVRGLDPVSLATSATEAMDVLTSQVSANTEAVLLVRAACGSSDPVALGDGFSTLLEQAAAQGQTVFVTGDCVAGALAPAAAVWATAVQEGDAPQAATLAADGSPRPQWQVANGLAGGFVRAVPDLSADVTALASTMQSIVATSGRQGSVSATLYGLAPVIGLYTQTDGRNEWEPATGLGQVNLVKLQQAWPRGSGSTTVSITSSTFSPAHGTSFNLTATVTSTSASAVPTGTITFSSAQGGTLGSVAMDTSGKANYAVSGVAAGTYDFKATYGGDGSYAAAASTTQASVNVQGEPTALSAVVSGSAVVGANYAVVVSARSASGVGTPSGTVSVAPQGGSSTATYTGTLVASGTANTATATVQVPAAAAGNVTLIVACTSPDPSFTCNQNINVTASIGKSTPAVVAKYTAPATASGTSTLVATVSNAGTVVPTGNVQFMDGATAVGTGILSGGTTSVPVTVTGGAAHSFTAVYGGDANFQTATSPAVSGSGTLATTLTTLSSTTGYSGPYGYVFQMLSTVVPTPTVTLTAPTGTITFTDSVQGVVGTASLSSSTATLPLSTLIVGTHTLTASYGGDGNYAASNSTANSNVVITVTSVTGTLAATLSPASGLTYGSMGTVNATLSGAGTSTLSAGTITATINGVNGVVYSGTLTNGAVGIPFPAPPPGTYTITVACAVSTNFTCSNTVTLPLKVLPGATVTTLAVTPSAPQAGFKTALTATVAPATTSMVMLAAITGTVTFTDNGMTVGTGSVSGGVATGSVILTGGKTHTLVATYSGDVNWASSASSGNVVTPTSLAPTIALTSNTLSPLAGANVTLAATVAAPAGASLIPSGTVTFYDTLNGTTRTLGTATLISNGVNAAVAVLSSTNFTAGTHSAYAIYGGDGSFTTITSTQLAITTGDFTLTMNPATLTITKGGTATAAGLVATIGGFNGTVTLGCTPAAGTMTTCYFTPNSLVGGGTTTLTVTTSTTGSVSRPRRWPGAIPAGIALGGVLLLSFPRRRRLSWYLSVVLLAAFATTVSGCADGVVGAGSGGGTGGGGTSVGTGTPLGTAIFTLTTAATDGSTTVRHNFSYQITVQ